MDDPVVISLVVTGIGMLMLFLALAFLCGLMYLMTAFIKDRPRSRAGEQRGKGAEEKRRVAAIAVALARAEQELASIGAPSAEGPVSAWQAFHHQRQLTLNAPTRKA